MAALGRRGRTKDCAAAAVRELNWSPRFGFDEVFAQLDRRSLEVMPPGSQMNRKPE